MVQTNNEEIGNLAKPRKGKPPGHHLRRCASCEGSFHHATGVHSLRSAPSTLTSSKCRSQRLCDDSHQGVVRRQWQRPCQALQRRGGSSQRCPKGWPVSFHGVVALFVKGTTILCKARLAMKTDRPTETDIMNWLMY